MATPTITEDTVTDWLREELEKHGIPMAATQIKFDKPHGFIKPDVFIESDPGYVIQAKLGNTAKTFDAIGQVWDSIRYGKVAGGFVIIYPEKLRRLPPAKARQWCYKLPSEVYAYFGPGDKRPPLHKRGNFRTVAKWMSEHVLNPPEYVEPDISFVVNQLRKIANYVTATLKYLTEKELEEIFGGSSVFENILQYEEGEYPLVEMQRATAHLLINQILFYHILSREDPEKYSEIEEDSITEPKGLLPYFKSVLDVNYSATFGFDVVSLVSPNALSQLVAIIKNIKALSPEKIRHDLLGQIFHTLIPLKIRKSVAAFYTNVEAAELLATLAVENPEANVIDLAVGSGGLLVAAYRRKKALLEAKKKFTFRDHKRFVEKEVIGIDVMPFAAHLAVINLSLQAPLYETEKVNIAIWDSTSLSPGKTIPSVSKVLKEAYKSPKLSEYVEGKKPRIPEKAYIKKGVATLDKVGGEKISLEKAVTVIMNPPFTRQERLPQGYKRHLEQRFAKYRRYFHGQLGLHGFFIFLSDRFLRPGGRIALVLPATTLRVKSMRGVRSLLSKSYEIEFVITAWKRLAFSEAAWVREILLVARKLRKGEKPIRPCNFVTLRKIPRSLSEARSLAEEIRKNRINDSAKTFDGRNIFIMAVKQNELAEHVDNWFTYIAVYDNRIREVWNKIASEKESKLVLFSKACQKERLTIIRGVETRSKDDVPVQAMMVGQSEDRLPRASYAWVVQKVGRTAVKVRNRYTNKVLSIPMSALRRALVTYSGIRTLDPRKYRDFVVVSHFDDIVRFLPGKKRRRILRLLRRWRAYVDGRLGNLLICRRYVPISPGFHHTCFYTRVPTVPPGMMWSVSGGNPEYLKILTLWMNSSIHLCQVLLKKIQDIWIDIHEYSLKSFLMLNPKKISQAERKRLIKLYNQVARYEFEHLRQQIKSRENMRKKIDLEILQVLGFKRNESKRLINILYDALKKEFEALDNLSSKSNS